MSDSAERGDEVTFGDLASMVWRRRWLVTGLCFVAAFGTYAMSKVMPKWYESSATLVTPKEGSGGLLSNLMVSGMLQQTPGVGVGMPTLPEISSDSPGWYPRTTSPSRLSGCGPAKSSPRS